MENTYGSLLNYYPDRVAEKKLSYLAFTERHIQAIWFEQKYFTGLSTHDGLPVHVLSPGIWNSEAGPDFKKAHLVIGNREFKGDIELHLSDEGWPQHQHPEDPRYNDVIFHLSLWEPITKKTLMTENGKTFHQAYLEPFLKISIDKIVKLIDLDLYPYKTYSGSGHCSNALFRKQSNEENIRFFRRASQWRLRQKMQYLQAHSSYPDQALMTGIARSLGYKNNTQQFLALLELFRNTPQLSQEEHFALALGVCQFFNLECIAKWSLNDYYLELRDTFIRLKNVLIKTKPCGEIGQSIEILPTIDVDINVDLERLVKAESFSQQDSELNTHFASLLTLPILPLSLHNIRPFNHPIRRIAYLAAIYHDPNTKNLTEQLIKTWNLHYTGIRRPKDWIKLRNILTQMIPSYDHPHFSKYYTFQTVSKEENLSLIGDTLKETIIINAFFPILYERLCSESHPEKLEAFEQFYHSFRSEDTGKGKYLIQRFFGDSPKSLIMQQADIQQGAYQLHHDFCQHYESSCEGCPFLERHETIFL